MRTRPLLAALALLAGSALDAGLVRGDGASSVDKAACLDAVAKGQRLRATHKLVEARDKFRVCARAECPSVVQSDCAGWLAEVEKALPTVVPSAKDPGGRDLVEVKVTIDGKPLASTLDGQALAVDAGVHLFRFERADGRLATRQLLVKEGEKAQSVAVVLGGAESSEPSPDAADADTASGTTSASSSGDKPGATIRLLGLLMGGAGLVGVGIGSGLALDAKAKDNTAATEPGVARQTDSSSAVGEGNVATVFIAVGAAAAAGGLVLWIAAPSGKADGARASVLAGVRDLAIRSDGRRVLLEGSF